MEVVELVESYEMARPRRKRLRSDESPCTGIQTKMFINQRIIDQNDSNKMRQIQQKTVRSLFDGARKSSVNKSATSVGAIWQQIKLYGDGRIDFCNNAVPMDLSIERRKANCCGVDKTFVQDFCSACNFNVCEECGYSCSDCGRFLCRGCVSLFGCGTTDVPICETCTLFN